MKKIETVLSETVKKVKIEYECEECGKKFPSDSPNWQRRDHERQHCHTRTAHFNSHQYYFFESEAKYKKFCTLTPIHWPPKWEGPGWYVVTEEDDDEYGCSYYIVTLKETKENVASAIKAYQAELEFIEKET